MKTNYFIFVLSLFFVSAASSQEPRFCEIKTFLQKEFTLNPSPQIGRLHLFRLGHLVLAGMAVGESDAQEVKKLAQSFNVSADMKFCTWYINEGNQEAQKSFVYKYTMDPKVMTPREAADNFLYALTESFTTLNPSFWRCAINNGYIGLGCNAQKHRGPSAFGMLLAFMGCEPQHAMDIVNALWDLNGVKPEVRLAIINAGYELGGRYPEIRAQMQHLTE